MLGTVSDTIECNPQTDEYGSDWWTAFNAANGVMSPSRLKPGQSPIRSPEGGNRTNNHYNNKCLICGDFFSYRYRLKTHFIDCVGRNGNPQGLYWNARLDRRERLGLKPNPKQKDIGRYGKIIAQLQKVNGVVLPSLLKPGQPPIQVQKDPHMRGATRKYNCPICGDSFKLKKQVKVHFAPCVHRNGNPHGYHWDEHKLKRRIAKETDQLYCEKDGGRDQGTKASTSETISSDEFHITSYEPSGSCNTSLAKTPRLSHERNDYLGAPPVTRTETEHGFGSVVIELSDEETADMGIDTAQPQVCGPSKIDCRSVNICFRVHHQSNLETYKRVHIVCLMKASSRPWPSL